MRKDLSGKQFGKLTVVEYSHSVGNQVMWLCRCQCGKTSIVSRGNLEKGSTISCGCHRRERFLKHGLSKTPEYAAWKNMHIRCSNPSNKFYLDYGGRGIFVCKEWSTFETFLKDMGPRPTSSHTLDRVDNDGPYEKSNCRWATKSEQNRNQRTQKKNRTGTRGVRWVKRDERYQAEIFYDGKCHYLGEFKQLSDAVAARKAAEQKYWSQASWPFKPPIEPPQKASAGQAYQE